MFKSFMESATQDDIYDADKDEKMCLVKSNGEHIPQEEVMMAMMFIL